MQNKRNRTTGVRGNRAVNLPALVPCTRLRVSCETFGFHVLNIFHPISDSLFTLPILGLFLIIPTGKKLILLSVMAISFTLIC